MPRHDPRDALGDVLVDAVVPVLGWPAFYKCSALSRAWRAALKRVGSDLRKRHAPPPPRFGLALLDLPLFVDRVVPFLSCTTRKRRDVKASWAGLFRLCPVSRAWNAAVAGRARRALRRLHDRTPKLFRPDAADVERWERDLRRRGFPDDPERDDDGYPWQMRRGERRYACYGPRGVVLPSHVRALLHVCAGAATVKDGYASTAANTFQPLERWRLVSSGAALRAIQREVDDFFEDFIANGETCLVVLRCWRVPMCGECYDIWQIVYLNLADGFLYYYNSRDTFIPIGTALEYVRGGWQHRWRPEQDGYYHVPGATMIVHSEDPSERQGIVYHSPPPDMDHVLPQRNARAAALRAYGDANYRTGNLF